MQTSDSQSSFTWLIFSLITVISWGLYGVLLHAGQVGMSDAINGRYKAFLFVGIAYFLSAVLAPVAVLTLNGALWRFPVAGMCWSLAAGIAGAVGAFCVLLAFGAQGSPAAVMAIVFGGAPIVNAVVALLMHPPAEGWGALRWQFFIGIALAALGGCLVTLYKPAPSKGPPPVVSKAK
jgi:hypothetical protein